MIDTVKIRIHGINDVKSTLQSEINKAHGFEDNFILPQHNELYNKMLQYKGKHFSSTVVRTREKLEVNDLNDKEYMQVNFAKKLTKHYQIRDLMTFTDQEHQKTIFKNVTGKYDVPSSYHGVTFTVNDNQGFIEFQFSIPKYLFGHSLAQFVPQFNSELYERNYHDGHKWTFQSKHLYNRLIGFIKSFLSDLDYMFSLEKSINLHYVELMRIDLCFNQYFDDKETALKYLDNLKRINYKRYRNGSKAPIEYNTSLSYTSSDGSYFKIYHKGTEYSESAHGDLKKHLVINRRYAESLNMKDKYKTIYDDDPDFIDRIFEDKGKGRITPMTEEKRAMVRETVNKLAMRVPFKVDFFKSEMDKVLRYEISLKGTFLTYAYKTKVFRKKCPLHNKWYDNYKKVKSIYDARNGAKRNTKVKKHENKNFKMFNSFLNRKTALLLSDNAYLKRFEETGQIDYDEKSARYKISRYDFKHTLLSSTDVGTFSPDMLQICIKHFLKNVRHYQVKNLSSYDNLVTRIKNYNLDVDKRVKDYNDENLHKTYNHLGKSIIKGNRIITKATQLLTRTQLVELRLKKISPLILLTIVKLLKRGKSLSMVFIELGLTPSQKSRYKKDLELFGICEQSTIEEKTVETCTDFSEYYKRTETNKYVANFFIKHECRSYE